ncbi:Ankyrin repeat [Durusdinium trenchii]|uniref:PH and SEC7 domain containing protein secG n=1 Tax=Durusdinium trenchii TaxID=1381693 RepID=A0ABP0JZT7_9DINO
MGNKLFCNESGVCPKAQVQHGVENELFDDTSACDSAGAVFTETLEELNEVDRLLLLFSASRNLAGVRWLIRLGANPDACDTNGTTCLHTACRSGSVTIDVAELLAQRKLSIDACDAAGWSALHVALFMGRRHISVMLMQHGANPTISNGRGQRAVELSSDIWLREAVTGYSQHWELKTLEQWTPPKPEATDVQVSSRLCFEPFFVPRTAVMKEGGADLQKLSEAIFNQRPGQGLAFVVATGCIRDFPVELSAFLGQRGICSSQVGSFLGEDFALSQTLRLEFINSVRLIGTGVVSCLAKVFKTIVIPTEMVKIDRLVDGIAQIWWRQHEQLAKKEGDDSQAKDEDPEVHGMELMRSLGNYDVLHQLMFATILLHWNLYAPLPPSQRVSAEEWLEISAGILPEHMERSEVDLKQVQLLIYKVISHNFFPQLEIWKPRSSSSKKQALEPSASTWARIVVGFPSLALTGAQRVENYRHLRSILSESTGPGSTCMASPSPSREGPTPVPVRARAAPMSMGFGLEEPDDHLYGFHESAGPGPVGGRVWLALHGAFLFLSAGPEPWAPYAFMRVADLVVKSDAQTLLLTLLPSLSTGTFLSSPTAAKPGLQVVFLLPDGRWQVLEVPRFQVQVSDKKQLELVGVALSEQCIDGPAVGEWNSASPISGSDDPLWYGKTRKEIEYATELEKSNGNAASREGDWKKAKRYWKNALKGAEKIQDAETEFRLHSNLALAYIKQKKIEKSLEHCEQALKERLKVAVSAELRGKVHYRRAEAFEAAGEVSKAIAACKLSLEVHPENVDVRKKLSSLKAQEARELGGACLPFWSHQTSRDYDHTYSQADQRKREKALFSGLRGLCSGLIGGDAFSRIILAF